MLTVQKHSNEQGDVKEQAWCTPGMSEALTEWGEVFARRLGIKFESRAQMLRTFLAIHLGMPEHVQLVRPAGLLPATTAVEVQRRRHQPKEVFARWERQSRRS